MECPNCGKPLYQQRTRMMVSLPEDEGKSTEERLKAAAEGRFDTVEKLSTTRHCREGCLNTYEPDEQGMLQKTGQGYRLG